MFGILNMERIFAIHVAIFTYSLFLSAAHLPASNMRKELSISLGYNQDAATKEIALANNRFAKDLYKVLATDMSNTIYSPISIQMPLMMLFMGAGDSTANLIASTLHYASDKKEALGQIKITLQSAKSDSQLQITTEMFTEKSYGVQETFKSAVSENFGSKCLSVDFVSSPEAARVYINEWVANHTSNRIKELFPKDSIDSETAMVLANAVNFEALWLDYYDSFSTTERTFYVSETKNSTVPIMESGIHTKYGYAETDTYQALAAPYKEGNASMLFFLPKEKFGLKQLEKTLENADFQEILASFVERRVNTAIPKFSFEFGADLKPALTKLGLESLFTNPDLNGISKPGERPLRVSEAVHKAFIEVNEAGTKAGAATGLKMEPLSYMPTPRFEANHPFMFFIVKEGIITFAGKFVSP